MPEPHSDLVRLHALAGTWVGQEVMHPNKWDPKGSIFDTRCVMVVGANGFVVTSDTEQHEGDTLTFASHGVFWRASDSGDVQLHSWDLFGAKPDVFRGGWQGERLVLVVKNTMGHWRYGFELGADHYAQSMEHSEDGESWNLCSEGSYRRE